MRVMAIHATLLLDYRSGTPPRSRPALHRRLIPPRERNHLAASREWEIVVRLLGRWEVRWVKGSALEDG